MCVLLYISNSTQTDSCNESVYIVKYLCKGAMAVDI